MNRQFSRADHLVCQFDAVLRTLVPRAAKAARPSPAGPEVRDEALSDDERRHAEGLMRINHTGEVCAQALYQGQGLTAKLPEVREQMEEAAQEEIDHLAWCEDRITELGGRTSRLNPLFYAASFGLGALAGAVGDRVSLGFVAATEEQVGRHLDAHLDRLPPGDHRSRSVLRQMAVDEAQHAEQALAAGGARFPGPVKAGMTLASRVMTKSVYKL
ncbi:2-polyprenyl-3-methyl-6-methoxy-1,4-benzoquinone monooxygenase [Halomonas koreensis]|uniref:3-demethoxyubiquinol 3-hydroxylase n=1 Tax=Halomonas koreensis TaxID=245385 RepID=A0ABU1G1Y8_9GAMM|nr:2-polyprenyl-3-methyl-6-methoxy-1,4-benzoquinone monooxygenase [Halomonas koreensis]MDR5866583.1 2-polyprenyl-3-methyl-6-methoxy-1,4-benzoquinone monooxygenase [Halomonas koreensis]